MTAAVVRAWQGVRWYLREFTGEARWDDYLAHCAEHGHTPMSRYAFERDMAVTLQHSLLPRALRVLVPAGFLFSACRNTRKHTLAKPRRHTAPRGKR